MSKPTRKKQNLITMLRIAGLMVGMLALLVLSLEWPLYALVIFGFWVALAHLEFVQIRRVKNAVGNRATTHDFVYAYSCWWIRPKGRPDAP